MKSVAISLISGFRFRTAEISPENVVDAFAENVGRSQVEKEIKLSQEMFVENRLFKDLYGEVFFGGLGIGVSS